MERWDGTVPDFVSADRLPNGSPIPQMSREQRYSEAKALLERDARWGTLTPELREGLRKMLREIEARWAEDSRKEAGVEGEK